MPETSPRARLIADAIRLALPATAGGVDPHAAAQIADELLSDVPAGPFMPVLRLTRTLDVLDYQRAADLSDLIRAAFPQAGPLLMLSDGAELTMLDDDDLAALGLARTGPRDTPETRVDPGA